MKIGYNLLVLATVMGGVTASVTGSANSAEAPAQQAEKTERAEVKLRPKLPLHKRMDFLIDRGTLLMVPKNSLIVVPESLKNKVHGGGKLEGKLVRLEQFTAANGSWFTTYPVTFEQMLGDVKISKEELERLKLLNKVVLATNAGQPAGVSPISLKHENLENRKE